MKNSVLCINTEKIRHYILIVVLLLAPSLSATNTQTSDSLTSKGAVKSDSCLIHFRVAQAFVDVRYMNNAASLSQLKSVLSTIYSDTLCSVDSIVVEVKSSPEGDYQANLRLTNARANSLKNYLYMLFPQLRDEKITTKLTPENWSELRNRVAADSLIPLQKKTLEIIDLTDNHTLREQRLKSLNNKSTFAYIKRHILPLLRSGTICTIWYRTQNDTIQQPIPTDSIAPEVTTDSSSSDHSMVAHDFASCRLTIPTPNRSFTASPIATPNLFEGKAMPIFALKTNLLYLAALTLNIEGELYVGNRWSINLEYQYAWWSNTAQHKYYRLAALSPEGRYWFASKRNFNGHFVGIYVGAGIYEFMARPTMGIQGEFFIAGGASYGWAFKATDWMNIELSVGVGYMMSEYREYYHDVDCYVYNGTQRLTYFGPTKAKISLVFPLQIGKRLKILH